MKYAPIAIILAGCIDGIAPGELGLGRRIDTMQGPIAATVPPLTDLDGDVFVVTGPLDPQGAPQPGTVYVGGARGGWSKGCATGTGSDAVALGWIGAVEDRAWLWTHDAILEIAADGTCTPRLDTDPRSGAELRFLAVAPVIDRTVSQDRAVAIVTTGTDARAYVITIELSLGSVLSSTVIEQPITLLGAGGGDGRGAFLVAAGNAASLVLATPSDGVVGQLAVGGSPGPLHSDLAIGSDGSIAGVLASGSLLVGDAGGMRIAPAPAGAAGIERDDDGGLWVTASGPSIAPVRGGSVGGAMPWVSVAAADASIARGVDVLDERDGSRSGTRWQAHSVVGDGLLVGSHPSQPYAVGVRGWLVGDAAVDRGGIPYNQVAFLPIGVTFP
jgi:hypothetical protein